MKEQMQPPGYLSPFQDQAFLTSMEPWTRSISSAHPSSSNHSLYLFFLLILFLIARWLEPPCFFLPSVRSTTRQTPRFLRGGSNCTVFFPWMILILESFVICVNLAIFLQHYFLLFFPQPWPCPGRIGRRQHWHLLWT